jgi:hypothetical protein
VHVLQPQPHQLTAPVPDPPQRQHDEPVSRAAARPQQRQHLIGRRRVHHTEAHCARHAARTRRARPPIGPRTTVPDRPATPTERPIPRQGAGELRPRSVRRDRRHPQHTDQLLTKRARRLGRLADRLDWPPNLWIAVSIEDARMLDRVDDLRQVPPQSASFPASPCSGRSTNSGSTAAMPELSILTGSAIYTKLAAQAGVPFFFKQWGRTYRQVRRATPRRPHLGRDAGAPAGHRCQLGESASPRIGLTSSPAAAPAAGGFPGRPSSGNTINGV